MKKFLLVLLPVALLLTSCLGDDSNTEQPVLHEVYFYDNFMVINNHGDNVIALVDELIAAYEEDNALVASAITVADNGNGTATFTANMDNVIFESDLDIYSHFRGSVVVALSGITSTLSDATSKVIDAGSLQFYDVTNGNAYSYGGEITIIDNSGAGLNDQNIVYTNFSIAQANSEELWTINYSYRYSYDESTDTYTWSEGSASGKHFQYGTFTVDIFSDIVKNGGLRFISRGTYMFRVETIGDGAYFTAEYGLGGSGTITFTATDGTVSEYQQFAQ